MSGRRITRERASINDRPRRRLNERSEEGTYPGLTEGDWRLCRAVPSADGNEAKADHEHRLPDIHGSDPRTETIATCARKRPTARRSRRQWGMCSATRSMCKPTTPVHRNADRRIAATCTSAPGPSRACSRKSHRPGFLFLTRIQIGSRRWTISAASRLTSALIRSKRTDCTPGQARSPGHGHRGRPRCDRGRAAALH